MMRYVLDTDHVSLILRGDMRLETRVAQESGVWTTVITYISQVGNFPKNPDDSSSRDFPEKSYPSPPGR
jgi:hypothetical protein